MGPCTFKGLRRVLTELTFEIFYIFQED